MIWATVSSWSYFCWLYRASPSLAAKNIINLISVLTIWWCLCIESSLVLLGDGVFYDQCILLGKLLAFALLHSVLQGQICLLLQVFLDFLLVQSSPLKWKGHLLGLLVLEGVFGLHRTVQLQLLQCYWSGIDLVYCDIEWFTLETNTDHSVIFEIASKYCILGSFVEVWDCKICSYFLSIMNLDSFEFGELFLHPRYNFCVR